MKLRNRLALCAASGLVLLATGTAAMAQRGPGPRDPHMDRRGPPPRPAPRPYYHNYNSGYYAAPVYAPPPVVYTPQPSVGINLVLPFHF
jgi:hypothetical protein